MFLCTAIKNDMFFDFFSCVCVFGYFPLRCFRMEDDTFDLLACVGASLVSFLIRSGSPIVFTGAVCRCHR